MAIIMGLGTAVAALLIGASLTALIRLRRRAEGEHAERAAAPPPDDPLAVALLAGGAQRLTHTVLFRLHAAGRITSTKRGHTVQPPRDGGPDWTDAERALLRKGLGATFTTVKAHEALAASAAVDRLTARLTADSFLWDEETTRRWKRLSLGHGVLCVAALLAAVAAAPDPYAPYLPLALLAGAGFAAQHAFARLGRLTPAGRSALKWLRTEYDSRNGSHWAALARPALHLGTEANGLGVALRGTKAISDAKVRRRIDPSGGSNSGGCGGCGGGCGG
ncbi:TIGR04222 domain-containing membrane protein [Streptomyces formicae]|uniref:TIGR04222 domain-containing membrane protein n=1 Tax=Streptomyces formicae TaxID=1616117 RepID=A0ABY3WI48_9ACTN|nr:TIGR04222 domain-containing membrane protein [Streptomyces formicae]UNM11017.1 TIGR04222 domain-containing membrane protein [Streptomyces formicae]